MTMRTSKRVGQEVMAIIEGIRFEEKAKHLWAVRKGDSYPWSCPNCDCEEHEVILTAGHVMTLRCTLCSRLETMERPRAIN